MNICSVKKWLCMMLSICLLSGLFTPSGLSEELPAVSTAPVAATAEPAPTATAEVMPAATAEEMPTATAEPAPAGTAEAMPAATAEAMPAATAEQTPTATAEAMPTSTAGSASVATAEPAPTPTAEVMPATTAGSASVATAEPATTATAEPAPIATAQAAPTTTAVPTPSPKPEIIGFEPSEYALTAEYGAALEELGLPAEVTALLSDGTTAQLAVTWTCVGDGLGGTAYIPEHENPLEAAYTFQAALADGSACPVALPTATVTYAMPQLVLMANGETESGDQTDFPYMGDFVRSSESSSMWLSWERVPGESLTVTVKSGSDVILTELSAYEEENLTLIVQPNADLTIKSGINCPYTVINSGDVYVGSDGEGGASCTINNANGENVYVYERSKATLIGGTSGRVVVSGVLHAEGITFMGVPTGHDRSTLYLKNAVMKSGIMISSGCNVYGDITMDNLSAGSNFSGSTFEGAMCEGIIKVASGYLWLTGNPSCIVELQGDASNISVNLYSIESNANVEVRVPQHVLDGVVSHNSDSILNMIRGDVSYHMEEIDLSSAVNTDFSLNEIGQKAFCVESFGFVDSAEEFAKIPAGEEASIVVNVKLEGENAHFYSFSESEEPTRAQSVLYATVQKLSLNATSFAFEAVYNGNDAFDNVRITQMQMSSRNLVDVNSPYLLDPIGMGITANVNLSPQLEEKIGVTWGEDGKPASVRNNWPASAYTLVPTGEGAENYTFSASSDINVDYTILPKEVTVSGEIRFTTNSRPSAGNALGQSGVKFSGFIGGDSYGGIRNDVTSLKLLDAEGNDLTKAEPGVYPVASITSVGSNYCFKPDDLTVKVLKVGDASVTMESWTEGETPAKPVAVSDTHTEQAAVITYAAQGTDVGNDALWSDQKPTVPGAYTVRAVWPEQLGYDRLVRTANFSIMSSVDWSAVRWNYDPLDPTRTTITLEGLPDYLAQDAVYSNNTALYLGDTGKYRTATVEFPSYPNLTVPDEIKSIEWYCKKSGRYGTYTLRLKAVNCDVTFTPRTAQPGQTLSAGAKIYSNQEVYIDVSVPEGYTLVALALTNSSFTQVVENKDESLKQDGARYKLTAPNDTKSYDLNVLAFAMPEDGISLSQGSTASLIYHDPSPDGKRPGYSETLDLTEYFDLAPEVKCEFTSSGSNNGKFSLNGSLLSWTSGDVTSAGRDFQVKQGITWDRWSSQNSVAIGQQTISSNASLKVVQEHVSQPNFNGTVTLPEQVDVGDTIQPVVENFTELDYAEVRWQWQRNLLGVWDDIPGATEMTYTVEAGDEHASLRLRYNVGMSADAYYMYTNETKCGVVWTYSVGMTADHTAIEKDEQIALSVAVRRNDGATGEGTAQLYLDGAAYGEPAAVTAGMAQFTLPGADMSVGTHKVYATFQSEYGGNLKSNEVTVTVNKADLSDLLITNVPTDMSEYYSGTTAGTRNSITVTYDKEKWPQGLDFSKCVNVTVYYNGKEDADQKSRLVTVSSDGAVYSICRLASYAMKVEINSDSYCGSITTGTLTITPSPVTIKPKDLYFAPGEKILLEPDILNDGFTSFGLRGNDYWDVWANYVVKDAQGKVVFEGPTNLPKDMNLPAGEYEVSIVYESDMIMCYDEYKTDKESF